MAVDEVFFPLSQGAVQFDEGAGLEELQSAWPRLAKQIVAVERFMNTTTEISSLLRRALDQSGSGIAGVVEAILNLCREYNLQLDWRANRCSIRPVGGDWEEVADLRIRKSVFRAILARIAVLCNEQSPDDVSCYGGGQA